MSSLSLDGTRSRKSDVHTGSVEMTMAPASVESEMGVEGAMAVGSDAEMLTNAVIWGTG